MSTMMIETERFIIDIGNLLRERKTDLSRVKKEKQAADKIIADCCLRIRNTLNNLEQRSINELNENARTKIQTIESQISYLDRAREKAGNILRRIKLLDDRNTSKILQHVNESRQLANDVEGRIQEIKRMLHKELIQFVINTDVENFITSFVSLGSVIDKPIETTECSDINVTPDKCSSILEATAESSNTSSTTSESSETIEATAESSDTSSTTSELPGTIEATSEYLDTHIAIAKRMYTDIATCESPSTNLEIADSLETQIAPAEYFDRHVATSELLDTSVVKAKSSDNQDDSRSFLSTMMQSESSTSVDIYENMTHKLFRTLNADHNTKTRCSNIYDSVPCQNKSFQNDDYMPDTLSESKSSSSSSHEFDPYETILTSSFNNPTPCTVSTPNSKFVLENSGSHNDFGVKNPKSDLAINSADSSQSLSVSTLQSTNISKANDVISLYKPVPMMRFNAKEKNDHHECNIFDLCICLDGDLLLIDDGNKKLKRFDKSYKLQDSLDLTADPYSVCTAGPGMAAVSLCSSRKIQFVHTGKKMSLAKSFMTRSFCRGIAYVHGYLNVCTGDTKSIYSGRIEVYNNSGKLQYCIPEVHTPLKSIMKYIAVNEVGQTRFVTMFSNDSVMLLSITGTVEKMFRHKDLNQPEGICTDGKGAIFVCGYHSNNIFRIEPKYQLVEEILNEQDGIKKPIAIHYDSLQSRMIVSCSHLNEVLIFTIKEK